MEDLSLHILDIVENSRNASASRVEIRIDEDTARDLLSIDIKDNGRGMDEEARARALDPFGTTRTTRRIGLGLPLLAQAARECGGGLLLVSAPGEGAEVRAEFRLSHPDGKPLGDLAATLAAIAAGRPELDLRFEYRRDGDIIARLDGRREEPEHGPRGV